jgi:ATP-binding cassette subfamily F protein 3
MAKEEVVIRFEDVEYKYNDKKIILAGVNFSVRRNAKYTIMGQNGAGKSTLFKLLTGKLKPQAGKINIDNNAKVAIAEQVVPFEKLQLSVKEYLGEALLPEKPNDLDRRVAKALQQVKLEVDPAKRVAELSGGQKARLLLAYALIQEPEILLLDEPTNNLDQAGINDLITFLIFWDRTCIVISHDADFLNTFTDGVLNLDVNTHQIEQFLGNYYDALNQIEAHIERQRLLNARIEKSIRDRFEKVNRLGGKSVAMRRLAKKVREDIEVDRENMVEVRREDKTIPEFTIPTQPYPRPILQINSVNFLHQGIPVTKPVNIEMRRGDRLLITGPNGIGKSTLLGQILRKEGAVYESDLRVGYYSQDFSELDFQQTALESLRSVNTGDTNMERIFAAAGRFLLPGSLLAQPVGALSEGQKGLLCYARFMVQEPGLLIMDEPTNHINFRHLPVIAKALNEFAGALILVSHMPDFVSQIDNLQTLDLTKL